MDLKVIRNQIASLLCEGFTMTEDDYELLDSIVIGKFTIDETIQKITESYIK